MLAHKGAQRRVIGLPRGPRGAGGGRAAHHASRLPDQAAAAAAQLRAGLTSGAQPKVDGVWRRSRTECGTRRGKSTVRCLQQTLLHPE